MIDRIRNLYARVDAAQDSVRFLVAAIVCAFVLTAVLAGPIVTSSYGIERQRQALVEVLSRANLARGDSEAVSLAERGEVAVGGRTYVNPLLTERLDLVFDEIGDIMSPGVIAEVLLTDTYPTFAPMWLVEQPGTTLMLSVVLLIWLLLVAFMRVVLQFLLVLAGTGAAVAPLTLLGAGQMALAIGGIGLLTFSFLLLMRTFQRLYERPQPIFAVAHTVLREASRTRIALAFIVMLLVILPLLPLWLDPDAPLRHQIQTFISRSLGATFYLAAFMTLFLGSATVAFEIRDRQIWHLVTKPVYRIQYILGKWLGIVTVNAVLMVIAAVSIFTFIQFLRQQPVAPGLRGQEDSMQVREAVLTARVGVKPDYPRLTDEQIRARVDDLISRDAELSGMDDIPMERRRQLRDEIQRAFSTGLRSVPPQGMRTFTFRGMQAARDAGGVMTLRYRFFILRDDEHQTFPVRFYFNENPELYMDREFVPTIGHVLTIPSELITDEGTLTVSILNMFVPPPELGGLGSVNFEEDGFEILYRAGSFEGNFVRAVVIDWVKLGFLGMLAICCATFLSFPVACLVSFTIFAAGTFGPFLATSLRDYYPPAFGSVDWTNAGMVIQWAFQSFIRSVAMAVVFLLEAFGAYRPAQMLVEGRLIPWSMVGGSILRIGVLWSGIALLFGWLVMRRRELAIYSGQG